MKPRSKTLRISNMSFSQLEEEGKRRDTLNALLNALNTVLESHVSVQEFETHGVTRLALTALYDHQNKTNKESLSKFFTPSTAQEQSANSGSKRGRIEVFGQSNSKSRNDFFKPAPQKSGALNLREDTQINLSDNLGEINRQKYILSMIQNQTKTSSKKTKADGSTQKNLSQLWRRDM